MCIVPFLGLYISRIAVKFIFVETNFVDCLIKATPTQVLLAGTPVVVDTAVTRPILLEREELLCRAEVTTVQESLD